MITPCGHRILIRVKDITEYDPVYKKAKEAGLALADTHEDHQRKQVGMDKGEVVSIGTTAFKDFGGDPWCKIGDTVLFAKYAGKIVDDPEDNKKYIVLNDEDIVCVLRS